MLGMALLPFAYGASGRSNPICPVYVLTFGRELVTLARQSTYVKMVAGAAETKLAWGKGAAGRFSR